MNRKDRRKTQDIGSAKADAPGNKGVSPCHVERELEPCTLVILGASGDLTRGKLIPALFNLYLTKVLPDPFLIVGCGRSEMDDGEFRASSSSLALSTGKATEKEWRAFADRLHYLPIVYDDAGSFQKLGALLDELERQRQPVGNRIFYLATPPTLYETLTEQIGMAGLSKERQDGKGWVRIVIEKPFGHDLSSAISLNHTTRRYFNEAQVYRIDHYLAKETVQNILTFRFANAIFEPIWNRSYIDHVHITAAETLGTGHRAGYYEQAGVLRDMFQNHMLQLLALTAMEPPSRFEAEHVRDERAKLFRSLQPFPTDRVQENIVLGQYGPGTIEGRRVPGYREEPGVDAQSLTPTYAMMRVFIDNWRWQGVPFYVASGKRLARKLTNIIIHFKQVPYSMFRNVLGEHITTNVLTLGIQPEERIFLSFQAKMPGARLCLQAVNMNFSYDEYYSGPKLDAYEKAIIDCMLGEQVLFWRQDAVELCWSYLMPILEECEKCGDREARLRFYEAGGWGPRDKDERMMLHEHLAET
ncbi:MAG: glucose-6-phosphate dehydrogenase [Deltaproteobacteria bacterium]|nr:glucose-6-phosphate dehydrogenase [Deltaproteobacteria bacterium]